MERFTVDELLQGIQKIADYKFKSSAKLPDDPNLPDELNIFYSRSDKRSKVQAPSRLSRRLTTPGGFLHG